MTSYNVKLGIKLCYKLEYVDCSSDAVILNAIFEKKIKSKNQQNERTYQNYRTSVTYVCNTLFIGNQNKRCVFFLLVDFSKARIQLQKKQEKVFKVFNNPIIRLQFFAYCR